MCRSVHAPHMRALPRQLAVHAMGVTARKGERVGVLLLLPEMAVELAASGSEQSLRGEGGRQSGERQGGEKQAEVP